MKSLNFIKHKFYEFFRSVLLTYKSYSYSIRSKIILLVVLAILIPLSLFGIYMYSFIHHNIFTQYINGKLEQSIGQINDSLVSKYRIIDNALNLFLSNQNIRSNLEKLNTEEQTYYLKARTRLEIETQLKYSVLHDYAWNSGLLKSVFVFLDEDNYYYLLHNYLPDDDIIKDHIDFYSSSKRNRYDPIFIKPSPYLNTVYFMKDVRTLITKKSIGNLVFGIDEAVLFDAYSNIIDDKSWKAFIFDSEGTIFFHTDRNLIGKKVNPKYIDIANSNTVSQLKSGNIVYIVDSEKISDMNMTSMIMVPKSEFNSDLVSIIPGYIYIIIFALIFSIIVSIYIVTHITKPIKDLIVNIEKVNDENFETKMPIYKYSELNEVSNTFNIMIDKIQYLINEVYKKQILVTESELKALQAQINPHFLFNVLETISWEARMSKNDTIYKMISSLGQLLRVHLTFNSDEKIKLREELEYVEFYLYLQKMRFREKLYIDIFISDESLLDYYLPKLIIQPIVENAVVHGLENKVGKGYLSIFINKNFDCIEIKVSDDGIGFDTNLVNIDCEKYDNAGKGRKHIGLINVNKRIKLVYGNDYGISVESKVGEGTRVIINIPFDRGDD